MRAVRIVSLFVFLRIVEIHGVLHPESAPLTGQSIAKLVPPSTEMTHLPKFHKITETVIEKPPESAVGSVKISSTSKNSHQIHHKRKPISMHKPNNSRYPIKKKPQRPKKPAKNCTNLRSQNETKKVMDAMYNPRTTQMSFISSTESNTILRPTTFAKDMRPKTSTFNSIVSENALKTVKKNKRANWHYVRKNFGPYVPMGCQRITISGICGTLSGSGTLPIQQTVPIQLTTTQSSLATAQSGLPTAQSGLPTDGIPESLPNDLDDKDPQIGDIASASPFPIGSSNIDDSTNESTNPNEESAESTENGVDSAIPLTQETDRPSSSPDASPNPADMMDPSPEMSDPQSPTENSALLTDKPSDINVDNVNEGDKGESTVTPASLDFASNLNSASINEDQDSDVSDETNDHNDEDYEDNSDAGDNNAEIVDYVDEHGSTAASDMDIGESEKD